MPVVVRIHLDDGTRVDHRLTLAGRSGTFRIECPAAPVRLEFDPERWLFHAGVTLLQR